jgi:hypothetical protein
MPPSSPQEGPCPTCDRPWSRDDFYKSCSECKTCKRARSRRHRMEQARKVAMAERLVDLLAVIVTQANSQPRSSEEVAV